MKKLFIYLLLNSVLPFIINVGVGYIWEKHFFKVILNQKWGHEISSDYFKFEESEEVKANTINNPSHYGTRGLLNKKLPEAMLAYISKLQTISGIFQYLFLGIFFSLGTWVYSVYVVNNNLRVKDILIIFAVNFVLFNLSGVPWLPLLFR
nr:hypothetical protein [Bacteroidota bacterium]